MIEDETVIVVKGAPIPKGSLKCVGRGGKHRLIEDNPRTEGWRQHVADAASSAPKRAEIHQPIGVEITSTIARPLGHIGARGLRPSAPAMPAMGRTGDVDKLARLVLDALTDSGLLDDDSQVVEVTSRKTYPIENDCAWTADALPYPGVVVRVYPMD